MNYMKIAINEALEGENTYPNPKVGAVIVKDNKIISTGYHQTYGSNHAERDAILKCKEPLDNATLYVTLEPCSHHGKTPPCTDLIIERNIKKVVIGSLDPTDKVNGMDILKNNGFDVSYKLDEESIIINYEFFKDHVKEPSITIKVASSLDGKIATKTFDSKGISSKKLLNITQKLRSEYDAIMVGVNTVLKDNPRLNIRINPKPITKVIIDFNFEITTNLELFNDDNQVVIFTKRNVDKDKVKTFRAIGVIVFNVLNDYQDLGKIKTYLGALGIKSILTEGGGTLNEGLLSLSLVDKLRIHYSPIIIGGSTSITSFNGEGVNLIKEAYRLNNVKTTQIENELILEGDFIVHRNN